MPPKWKNLPEPGGVTKSDDEAREATDIGRNLLNWEKIKKVQLIMSKATALWKSRF